MSTWPFIGEIDILPYHFAPQSYAWCEGQLLPISQNQALFSLIGTLYGGDGRVSMAVPNLKGRAPRGYGNGPGLTPSYIGQNSGAPSITLTENEMPSHDHTWKGLFANSPDGESGSPGNTRVPASLEEGGAIKNAYVQNANHTNKTELNWNQVSTVGLSQPHNNMQPYLAVRYCIALDGQYPSRN
ncbi:MAG TPA: phage tail protein [Desulfobacteraceae bacterium]|nr:phage tail protein [Desulfobacteraceae bacterium]